VRLVGFFLSLWTSKHFVYYQIMFVQYQIILLPIPDCEIGQGKPIPEAHVLARTRGCLARVVQMPMPRPTARSGQMRCATDFTKAAKATAEGLLIADWMSNHSSPKLTRSTAYGLLSADGKSNCSHQSCKGPKLKLDCQGS
jgi:hypothetical protein